MIQVPVRVSKDSLHVIHGMTWHGMVMNMSMSMDRHSKGKQRMAHHRSVPQHSIHDMAWHTTAHTPHA